MVDFRGCGGTGIERGRSSELRLLYSREPATRECIERTTTEYIKKTLDKVISRHPHGLEIFVSSTRKSSLRRVFLRGILGHPGVFLGHP